jgi:hypothetical protein
MRAHCTHVRASLLHAASHQPFLTANVVGADARLTAFENWACEAALEVAHIGVLNDAESSLQWRHVLAPFAPNASAWSIGEPMLLVAVQKHASHSGGGGGIGTAASPIVLSHIGVKLYPLKAHITYDLIMSVVAFAAPFTDEEETQQEAAQSTSERRVAFLPQAGLLSAAEANESSSSSSSSSSSALSHRHRSSVSAFESKVDLRHQTRKSLAAFANRIYDEHRRLLLEDAAASSSAESTGADDEDDEAAAGGGGAAAKGDAASALLSLVDPVVTFMHFRIEAIVVVASYLTGVAGKSHGITDIEGLQIEFPVCLYQRESLKVSEMLWRLKMRLIVELLKQVGGTLGDILGFKFGFDSAMKRRAQGILDSSAIQQSVVVADDDEEEAAEFERGRGGLTNGSAAVAAVGSTAAASGGASSSSSAASSAAASAPPPSSSVASMFSLFTASSPVKITKRSLLLGNSTENRGSPPPALLLAAARMKSPPASSGTPLASVSEFDDEAEAVLQYHFNH